MNAADDPERGTLERFTEYRSTRARPLRNQLVEEHLPLAQSLAQRYANRREPLDDLQQVAVLGLLKAVDRFDPGRGVPFHGFAIPTIVGELRRHFRDRGWMVRVPRRLQELHLRLDPLVADLAQRLGRSPTAAEVAEAAGVDEEEVLQAMDAVSSYRPASLDAARRDQGSSSIEQLGSVDAELGSVEDRAVLVDLLGSLSSRERRILHLRFFEEKTQAEIAAEIGISQMHVSRILTRCLLVLGDTEVEADRG